MSPCGAESTTSIVSLDSDSGGEVTEGGPDVVPTSLGSMASEMLPARLGGWAAQCGPEAPKRNVLFQSGLVVPGVAKPSLQAGQPPLPRDPQHPHSLHPPIIRQQNAPTSRQPAGCHFGACTRRLFLHRVVFKRVLFDLVGLFPPLVDWQRSDTAFDKSQDYCTVPGMADAGS